MKKGFTLIELLVVVSIMGLMGTAAVGGYRQLQRGMEERGVMQNVNAFIRSAYQRAQIDRQPTAILFWNELLREGSDDETEVVVGRAVAVRRYGRVTKKDSTYLIDEFGGLELAYPESASGKKSSSFFRAYRFEGKDLQYIPVGVMAEEIDGGIKETFLSSPQTKPSINNGSSDKPDTGGQIRIYGLKFGSGGKAGTGWPVGTAYGFEFASLQLPHGFIFEKTKGPDSIKEPIEEVKTLFFAPDESGASKRIRVYQLRPGEKGVITGVLVATSDSPSEDED